MVYVHHHGAAAAAAEQQRLMREEEEEMTPYTPADLATDYEFKILRSATAAFRVPSKLQEILQEEALAGWVLVEKFDNSRLRLKRPTKAKERDGNLNFDPYRTYVGLSPNRLAFLIIGITLAIIGLGILTALALD